MENDRCQGGWLDCVRTSDELQAQLKGAFEQWYEFKDIPGKGR